MPLRRRRNRDTVDGPATLPTVTDSVVEVSPVLVAARNLALQLRMNDDLIRIRPISLEAYDALMVALNA